MTNQKEIIYDTPAYPRQLRLDTTTACNASCLSCHKHLTKRKGSMSQGLVKEILNDVSKWEEPLIEIVPVNYGEFFLHKDWLWILRTIEAWLPKTNLVIPTNGFYLDDETTKKLCNINNLYVVNFSVNAYFGSTYEAFTGLPAKTIDKIRHSVELIKVIRPDVSVWTSMVFDPAYSSDLEKGLFVMEWEDYVSPQILPAASAGRGTKIEIPRLAPCRSLFSDIVIGYDRKLSLCCFDADFSAYDLGHYSSNLLNDWNSEKLNKFRKIHNEGRRQEIPLCKGCTYE